MRKHEHFLEGKGNEIFLIFFKDWFSLKEASKEYDPNFDPKQRCHTTVAQYFYRFKNKGWLDEGNILKLKERKGIRNYNSRVPRWKSNLNPFYEFYEYYKCEKEEDSFTEIEKKIIKNIFESEFFKVKLESCEDFIEFIQNMLLDIVGQNLLYLETDEIGGFIEPKNLIKTINRNDFRRTNIKKFDRRKFYLMSLELESGNFEPINEYRESLDKFKRTDKRKVDELKSICWIRTLPELLKIKILKKIPQPSTSLILLKKFKKLFENTGILYPRDLSMKIHNEYSQAIEELERKIFFYFNRDEDIMHYL